MEAIIEAKLADAEVMASHVRSHPDMHGHMTDDSWLTQVGVIPFRPSCFLCGGVL